MGEERDGRFEYYDRTTIAAADICGRCQKASKTAERTEPIGRQERARFNEQIRVFEEVALREWAKENHSWLDEQNFLQQYSERQIGAGAEQKVFLKLDGLTVIKINAGRFHGTWLEYFNRLLFHAFLFPATKYTTVGFTEDEGSFAVLTQQPFAILTQGAPRTVVEPYLVQQGFMRVKNDDYYSKVTSVKLEDLHDENVFLDEHGHLLFIDPVIYFETADLKLGGDMIFHFPFK